jgi:zinc/manganese transport system substrate-binding protein
LAILIDYHWRNDSKYQLGVITFMQNSFKHRVGVVSSIGLLLFVLVACGNTQPGQPAAAPTPAAEAPVVDPTQAPNTPVVSQPTAEAATTPIKVVATYSILGDLVQNVAGDRVELVTLVGPGSDSHVYEPTPRDNAILAEARLVFENGLMFEGWIDDLYTASGSAARRVVVSERITPLIAAADAHHDEEEAHSEEEADGEFDPHMWHDPTNVMLMVEAIRDALIAVDSANAATYQANAAAYLAQLKQLDAEIEAQVAALPAERRKLVTSHDTFGYYAQRYGFEVIGTAIGTSTEAADPSAGEIATLVDSIKAAGVPAIFAENVSDSNLIDTIAREAGVQLAPALYTDALGETGSTGATYLEMMRFNTTTIVTALAQ